MKRRRPATLGALLCLLVTTVGAQAQTPGAPTIDSVTAGDSTLTVVWTAPGGVSGITAYDLRYIRTDASDKTDPNWTPIDDAWTTGDLQYTITGLTGGVGYDVQVRAVTTGDGEWSATATRTPTLGAPTISSILAGDEALTVVWTAPGGVSGITAYDLR